MTPDLQEALSRKHSDACFILLRLRSGKTALFNSKREIVAIDALEFLIQRRELTTYIDQEKIPRIAPELLALTTDLNL